MGVTESPNRLRAAESAPASVRSDRNSRSFAINAVDAPWLRAQSKMALGAMDLPSLGDLRAAFVELAAQGERTRAGFTLSSSARRWMFDPHRLAELAQEVVVESPAPMGTSDAEEVITGELETLLETTTVDNSIATHFTKAGRHLVYAQNHAIGDAHLTFRIPSALVQIARGGGLPRWVDNQPATHPLWSAVAQSVRPGSNPLVGLWRDRPSRLLARPARDVDHGEPAPPRTAFRCLSRSGWQDVKAWRRENAPDASLAASTW